MIFMCRFEHHILGERDTNLIFVIQSNGEANTAGNVCVYIYIYIYIYTVKPL